MPNRSDGTAIWITWESQPRNRSMARELGAALHEFLYGGPRPLRYARCTLATTWLLLRTRPTVVFAPNPSLALTLLLLILRMFLGFRLASDSHYGGVVASPDHEWVQRLLDLLNRHVDVVIVTNPGHATLVSKVGGNPVVCPDPLPQRSDPDPHWLSELQQAKTVFFVCSFGPDEPYEAVFTAAPILAAHGLRLLVSGDYRRAGIRPDAIRDATLLGYVDRHAYDQYVHHADVLIDLTTFQDCLVCGAYEAMAAGKPCVLSRTPALTDLFTHGTEFCSHEPEDVARAVVYAYNHRDVLAAQTMEWVARHRKDTRDRIRALRAAVGLLADTS